MDFSGCIDDDSFGPAVHGCRDDFDFTVKFEQIFFLLIPASIFIPVALTRIIFLVQRPELVRGSLFRGVKLAATILYAALQLSLLVTISIELDKPGALLVSSSAIVFVSALCIIVVSFLEHSRSPRPSILLNIYLVLTLLFDVVQVRTLWLASVGPDETTRPRLCTTSVVVKFLLILLESQNKSRWVQWDVKEHSPEETSGIFSLVAFLWLNRIFSNGYRKILTPDDLIPLDESMTTAALRRRLMNRLVATNLKGRRHGLARGLARSLAIPLLLPIGPRIALIGFRFCQPFLINTLLSYLQQPADASSKNAGYGLIGATVIVYTGIAVSSSLYWYLHERTLCMSRGCLAGAIYKKTTEMRLSASGDSAALTLMSTDVERIRLGFLNLHEFWANSIEVGLASWLLQRQLGSAFAAPLVVAICCIMCGAFANRSTGKRQKAWMDKIQKRVGLTANVISNMKHLKISGLTIPVENLIQDMRVDELKTSSSFRTVYVIVVVFGYIPLALSPVLTFAFTARTLGVSTIFTSLSYLILLADPLGYLFQNSPYLLSAFACLERMQSFLERDPRVDFRKSERRRSTLGLEKECSNLEDGLDKSDQVLNIFNGSFGWETSKLVFKNISLDIPIYRLTMVVGPVGSGKSTLCKVLLGEVPISRGRFVLDSGFAIRRVGYCDQTPYLWNASIRENILGFSPFDPQRYREVIEATMLGPDLSVLPNGDETKIGSNGILLSGGQQQRVSMARALYHDSTFFIFDDILSGLDADTEDHVFHHVFGPDGLLRRRNATAVLCTHNIRRLPSADHIIALGANGNIVEQGTFQILLANEKYVHGLGIKPSDGVRSTDVTTPPEAKESMRSGLDEALAALPIATSHMNENLRMTGDSTVYQHYLASLGTKSIVAFTMFGFGWGFFYNWGTIWLKYWSEDATSSHPSRSNSFYIGLYAVFQMSYLGSMFFCFMICFRTMIQVSGAKLHKAALSTVINAPLRFFTTTDTGLITNLFSQDMTLIDNELPIAVTNLAMDICNALGMAAVIATSSPFLAITYPFIFIILYGIQRFYLRTSRQLRLLDLEAKSPLYTHFLDTIKDVATFRAFGWVQLGIDTNDRLLDLSQRPTYLLAMVQRWLGFTLQIVVAILAVVVVTLATQLPSSTGLTGASLVTLMTFGDILNYIIRWYTQIETSIGAVSRLKNFSENVKSESLEGEDVIPPRGWPFGGDIQITGLSASYDPVEEAQGGTTRNSNGSSGSSQNLALKDLTLTIQPGNKVAICGRSGSGKSSLLLLLLRLLDPLPSSSQNITIDSLPLHTISRSTLRQRIIAVSQNSVFLPNGSSIISNLDPFNTSTESECKTVLETVGLWTTVVESRGGEGLAAGLSPDTLSQGQKQLFSVARAILRARIRAREHLGGQHATISNERGNDGGGGGILLLDEITSNLDQNTDRAIQGIIQEEFKTYTIVMINHRLEMIMDFDTVVVMDKGSVVESGDPRILVEREEGGRFRELWEVQGNKKVGGITEVF